MDIFLSYSWSCSDLASKLEEIINAEPAFHVLRDIHAVEPADHLRRFMDSIRESFCAVVVINEQYLKSENCAYELTSFYKERDFSARVIPLVVRGTPIFSKQSRREALSFWEERGAAGLTFEPVELERALEAIADLNCISYDQKEDPRLNRCGPLLMKALIQRVFQKELRPSASACRQVPLPQDHLLCIDFGTSYTLASIIGADGKTYMVPDGRGEFSCPSVIELHRDGHYAVGNAVSTRMVNPSTYVIRDLKRTLLKTGEIACGPHRFSTALLTAMLLHSMKRNAEDFLGVPFTAALLSIPVDFHQCEITLLETAAKTAGLDVRRIIQESSSASLLITSHAADHGYDYFLNIDLGGGTLDISAANFDEGVCEILFSIGDHALGSIDYDQAVCRYVINQMQECYGLSPIYPDTPLYTSILARSEQAKIELGTHERVLFSLEVPKPSGDIALYTLEITRQTYDRITSALTGRLAAVLKQAKALLEECVAQDTPVPIYLTGQGSKLFSVRRLIQTLFPGEELIDQYQEGAVCQGLARQSGVLSGSIRGLLLLDVFHHCIDVLCDHYDEEKDLIYIGEQNHVFHRLINPQGGRRQSRTITIPSRWAFEISFTEMARKKGCEILIFDFDQTEKTRTLRIPLPVSPFEITEDPMLLVLSTGAGGDLSAMISTSAREKES